MADYKSLAEWLEAHGNPKHSIAEGENGSMVIAIEDNDSFSEGLTLYSYTEKEYPNGHKHFWMNSGWGIRKEYFPALKKYLDENIPQKEIKMLEGFGKSTQREFDDALAAIPGLIAKARQGDDSAGQLANDLLWKLANEGFNTRTSDLQTFKQLFNFGRKEA